MKNLLTPKSDLVFKLLFTEDAEILIDLINSVQALPENRRVRRAEVLNPGISPETVRQKFIILDILVKDESGRQYDIEMQVRKYDAYPKRTLYYLSRMIAGQLNAGDDYGEIDPVIGIHFLDYEQFPGCEGFHFRFELRDERYPHLRLTEDLCIHLFELPKAGKHWTGLQEESLMSEWLHFLNHAHEEGEESMRAHYTNSKIKKAFELLEKMSADEDIRLLAEEREKALRDEISALASARREGEKIGEQIGMEKGEQIGMEKGERIGSRKKAMETAGSLLKMNVLTPEQIAEVTGLDIEEVKILSAEAV